jgi:hypothetical protein
MSVDEDQRSGRMSTRTPPENIANVHEAILADRRRTIHDVCEIAGQSYRPFRAFWQTIST